VWMGNFGWGDPKPSPGGNGSVSRFNRSGHAMSGPLGYQGGVDRAQGVVSDAEGNIWIASYGNSRIYVFPKGNPQRAIHFPELPFSAPFDIQIAADGSAWVTLSGGLQPTSNSRVARYALVNGRIVRLFSCPIGHSLKGFQLDSEGYPWIASGGDNCVYRLNPLGEKVGTYFGGGINAPWSTAVDGDDNVWVANFGPEDEGSNFTNASISKLAGANPFTRPPGLQTGEPISPESGYTLPTGGSEVLLHNGQPLYGPEAPPCFSPLMRLTSVSIDRAGNVWAINNWKPSFDADALLNPGGDGICIFVGLATPVRRA
jgi:hypothetical protein